MIISIQNAISPTEAAELYDLRLKIAGQKLQTAHWQLPVIQKILDQIQAAVPAELLLESPSYISLEQKTSGHPAHIDGCRLLTAGYIDNHMSWCSWSATLLVSDPALCSGGIVRFADQIIRPADHYCTLYLWPSHPRTGYRPVMHSVDAHNGCRVVLLCFLAQKPIQAP